MTEVKHVRVYKHVEEKRQNVAWESVKSAIVTGGALVSVGSVWNVALQQPGGMAKHFVFDNKSYQKWTLIPMGVGMVGGAIAGALGAAHNNRHLDEVESQMQGFTARREAEKNVAQADNALSKC